MIYEGLVRIIRPPLPELEAVHQHLYGLYHYYGPGYDLEKIRERSHGDGRRHPGPSGGRASRLAFPTTRPTSRWR